MDGARRARGACGATARESCGAGLVHPEQREKGEESEEEDDKASPLGSDTEGAGPSVKEREIGER